MNDRTFTARRAQLDATAATTTTATTATAAVSAAIHWGRSRHGDIYSYCGVYSVETAFAPGTSGQRYNIYCGTKRIGTEYTTQAKAKAVAQAHADRAAIKAEARIATKLATPDRHTDDDAAKLRERRIPLTNRDHFVMPSNEIALAATDERLHTITGHTCTILNLMQNAARNSRGLDRQELLLVARYAALISTTATDTLLD